MRQFEAADAPLGRARERALLMAENFALHQRFGDCRAIDRHERPVGARRKHMNRARHHLFSGSCFAGDQHGRGRRRHHLNLPHHFLHRAGRSDQSSELSRFAQLPRQRRDRLLVAHAPQRAVQQRPQHRRLQRLLDVPECAGFDRLHHALVAAASRDDDHRNPLNFFAQMTQQFQAVHARQLDVGENHLRVELRDLRERVLAARHAQHFAIPLAQQSFVALAGVVLVFNDQDALQGCRVGGHREFESTSSLRDFQASVAGKEGNRCVE